MAKNPVHEKFVTGLLMQHKGKIRKGHGKAIRATLLKILNGSGAKSLPHTISYMFTNANELRVGNRVSQRSLQADMGKNVKFTLNYEAAPLIASIAPPDYRRSKKTNGVR